jgi:hypothetical protein
MMEAVCSSEISEGLCKQNITQCSNPEDWNLNIKHKCVSVCNAMCLRCAGDTVHCNSQPAVLSTLRPGLHFLLLNDSSAVCL